MNPSVASEEMHFQKGKYKIELKDESGKVIRHSDDSNAYKKNYADDDGGFFRPQIGIKIYENDKLLNSALLKSSGGITAIHETSQLIRYDHIVVCCARNLFNLTIPELDLNWIKEGDKASCFQIYAFEEDFIIHGELSISRISKDGTKAWEYSGDNIFVTLDTENEFSLRRNIIRVKDFQGKIHKLDMNGNLLK